MNVGRTIGNVGGTEWGSHIIGRKLGSRAVTRRVPRWRENHQRIQMFIIWVREIDYLLLCINEAVLRMVRNAPMVFFGLVQRPASPWCLHHPKHPEDRFLNGLN
jgi:hypothetical protein